ncbi:hypothetical protein Q5P01_006007 [Channa striata]|uniref:Uncharacterized protein n=1 Tax=Channa striata TaxID=64152 RepID=A0AA88NHF2_CHASR|nr:hypothetical protein Q5P01_006007 [Channa striata]
MWSAMTLEHRHRSRPVCLFARLSLVCLDADAEDAADLDPEESVVSVAVSCVCVVRRERVSFVESLRNLCCTGSNVKAQLSLEARSVCCHNGLDLCHKPSRSFPTRLSFRGEKSSAAQVDYGQERRASKPHQDQPQQAAAFLMHQDTSLTTTIEHPQGKRQGQPQQAAAFLTLPGAGGLPDSRKHHTPGRLLSPLGYPGPERVSAVQKPPSSLQQYPATQVLPGINLVPRYLPRGSTRPGQQNVAPPCIPRGRRTPDKQQTSHQVDYGQERRASKPHQDQPQQAAAFLMHQDTSLTTTIEHPPGQETGPAAASCCLPDSARGRRTAGQPQAPHSRPVVVTVRLPRSRASVRRPETSQQVDYGQARRASKPHQDQPQQAAAFLMHQDTSLTTTIEHPQGKRQGQPQQAAAFLTLPGAGGLRTGQPQAPHSRPVVVTVRLPRSRASVRRPETSQQVLPGINLVPRYLPRGSTRPGQQNVAPTLYPQGKKDPRQAADITPGQLLAPLGYSNLA